MTRKEEEALLLELEKLRDNASSHLLKLCEIMTVIRKDMKREPVCLQIQREEQLKRPVKG